MSLKENGVASKEEQDGWYRIPVCSLAFPALSLFRRGDFEMAVPTFFDIYTVSHDKKIRM